MPAAADHPTAYRFRTEVMLPPPPPPDCPVGWETGPPDFVGVGCQRSGTTRWWRLLTAHPAIHRPDAKELHFFDGFQGCEPSPAIAEAYRRHFPRPPGLLCGEWTPRYALDHWTPPLLAAAAPEARFLVSLRDPIERFVSGLAWTERRGVRSDDNVAGALRRSMYLPQLRHLLRYVDRSRVLVLQFETTLSDPIRELRRVYAALGVDPTFVPENVTEPVNASGVPGQITPAERRQLVHWLEGSVVELATEFPELDLSRWPNFAHLA